MLTNLQNSSKTNTNVYKGYIDIIGTKIAFDNGNTRIYVRLLSDGMVQASIDVFNSPLIPFTNSHNMLPKNLHQLPLRETMVGFFNNPEIIDKHIVKAKDFIIKFFNDMVGEVKWDLETKDIG